MNENKPVSKVLVLDDCPVQLSAIRRFCDEHNLIGLTVKKSRLFSMLRTNIDLGAILLSESYGGSIEESAAIATRINALRPELPIVMRRAALATLDDLPEHVRRALCAAYVADDMTPLARVVDEYIFSLDYPNALVRGISEISEAMLASLFPSLSITWDTPHIVRDRIIFGEVFSLIPLESAWCRGYMMIQAEEQPTLDLLNRHRMYDGAATFRDLNSLLGEITNLIWGAFKTRYVGDACAPSVNQVQVPLLINHKQRYISFGTGNPQLCFTYRLKDEQSGCSVKLDQRFVFSLNWSPADFSQVAQVDVDAMVEAGELELF